MNAENAFGSGFRILMIEDNLDNARIMRRSLERHGFTIEHAEDGESGLNAAMSNPPDLILLDLGLPDVDGQTIAAILKSAQGFPRIPVVVVTAWPSENARHMIEAYGCEGYIPKPIDTRAFAGQVRDFLPARP